MGKTLSIFLIIEMLNDSFRIYCNKIADFKSHNVDIPFLLNFYEDMLQNLT
jgi:hypothetical protein